MWRKFCGWILRVWGWETSPFLPPEPKCILLGVPHTSMLDFVVAYLFYISIGGKTFCMVKSSLFFPPLGWILRAIGGIPVDRKHPSSVVRSVLKEMEKEGEIGELYPYLITTTGNSTSVADATRFGKEIAEELKAAGVQGVILTST